MTDEKKVVVKINYSANRFSERVEKNEKNRPVVYEWHVKRIVVAVLTLILITGGAGYLLFGNGDNNNAETLADIHNAPVAERLTGSSSFAQEAEPVAVGNAGHDEYTKPNSANPVNEITREINVVNNEELQNRGRKKKISQVMQQLNVKHKPDKLKERKNHHEVYPEGLVRALISTGMWKNEPFNKIVSPVVVPDNKAIGIYYFTELKGMRGKTFFHVWKYNGQIIYKSRIVIKDDYRRVVTSKLINRSSLGQWTVQLLDADGKLMNEIKFTAISS